MDDQISPFPPAPPENEPLPEPVARRRHLLPTAAVILALGVGASGVAYGATARQGSSSTTTSGSQGSASSEWLQPGYAYGQYGGDTEQYGGGDQQYGSGGDQQFGEDPQQYGGDTQQFGAPDTGDQSTGSTTQADQAQLTGLVRIVSTMKYDEAEAAGTGLVLTSGGEVVTNHHVVADATSVKATVMSTGKTYTAKVVGTDPTSDVAVLQLVDASGLDTVTPDQDSVAAGDQVTAVGDGNGTTDYLSAAAGQVLAQDQSITTQAEATAAGESLTGLIEISSDVVGGYSGGATYDAEGEVLGMTTAASSGTSDIVGYAIPIATVLRIASDLESGVTNSAYSYGYPAFLGVGLASGTTVGQVYDGTGAAEAGLAAGDTITSIDGTATGTTAKLRSVVAAHQAGDKVSVSWTDQGGTSHTGTLTLGKGPVR
jgi:S1-C subfamily serine protease